MTRLKTISDIKYSDPFLDFSIPTSEIIDNLLDPTDDEPELIIAEPSMSDDDINVQDTNEIDIDRGLLQRKKIVVPYMKA